MHAKLTTRLRPSTARDRAPSSLATANSIIAEFRRNGRLPTMMQVQRLALMAQGWSLALTGAPVFTDAIVVQGDTAAVPTIFGALRRYGTEPVTGYAGHPELPSFDHPEDDHPERLEIIRTVVQSYGSFSAYRLGEILRRAMPDAGNGDVLTSEALRIAFSAVASGTSAG